MSSSFKEKLKQYYGLSEETFQKMMEKPSLSLVPDISSFPNVNKAIKRLEEAKEKHEKVLIYGDYDFDGVSSTSICQMAFASFGLLSSYYVPSRYLDGYGLNETNVIKIAKAGYSLIFCVDNGVSALSALKKAEELGIDVIVLDHHEYESVPDSIVTLIHPKTVNLTNPSVSAGFLSYLFAKALLKKDNDYWLTLGATSLLSDAMPLRDYNRNAVNLALILLNEERFSSFSLLDQRSHYFATNLQMNIIPKINAVGRVEEGSETNRLVRYFVSENLALKKSLASYFEMVNTKRKELTKEAENQLSIDTNSASIVLLSELPEGLNGLLANRLLNEYQKPVAVFSSSKKEEGVLVGSLRSQEGFDVLEALNENRAPLLTSGGHSFAGGVSLKKEDFPLFKKDFEFAALKHRFEKKEKKTIPLEKEECTMENFYLLNAFGPFGSENEEPSFSLIFPKDELTFTKNGKYLSTRLKESRLFSFSFGESDLPKGKNVLLQCKMSPNEWMNRLGLDLIVEAMKGTD